MTDKDQQVQQDQQEDSTNDDFDADFAAGFSASTTTENPSPSATDADKKGTGDTPAPAATDTPPQYVQITQEQFDKLMQAAAKVDEIEATTTSIRDTAMGKIGGIERAMNELRTSASVSDEDLAQLREEYPDLAELKVFQKLRGGGAAAPDPDAMAQMIQQHAMPLVQQSSAQVQEAVLDMLHEDWRETIGMPDDNGNAPDTEFRRWLAAQPDNYADQVLNASQAKEIHRALTKFKSGKQAPAGNGGAPDTGAEARRRRMAAATPVKGDGGPITTTPSDDEQFAIGFKESYRSRTS